VDARPWNLYADRQRRVSIDLRHSHVEFTEFYSLKVC
jgi:hypothetical protein